MELINMFFIYLHYMNNIIWVLLFNALLITGIYISCNYEETPEGIIDKETTMIFSFGKFLAKNSLPNWLFKPLIGCIICMSSIHSSYVYWMSFEVSIRAILIYPLYILALSGLMTIIKNGFDVH